METQNQMKNTKDKRRLKAAEKLFGLIEDIIKTEQELISLGCIDSEEFGSTEDISVWIRRTLKKHTTPHQISPISSTGEEVSRVWIEKEPHRILGETLLQKLQRKAPTGFETQGCSIRIQDNRCYFYISASISLDALHAFSEPSETSDHPLI